MVPSIIDEILRREGPATDDPTDRGGRTAYGISERANPEAWADGVVTEAEARAIYERKYVTVPGFHQIADHTLRSQLVDFGVNSGPGCAIQKLQSVLGVAVDGVLGPQTLSAVARLDGRTVNNGLMAERIKMIGRLCKKDPSQLKYINGWLNRALEFLQ